MKFKTIFLLLVLGMVGAVVQTHAQGVQNKSMGRVLETNYLQVDSAMKVGQHSLNFIGSSNNTPYNHIFATNGPLIVNGLASAPAQNTFLNGLGGQVAVGFTPMNLPGNIKFAVNGNAYLAQSVGIGTAPHPNMLLRLRADNGPIGLVVEHNDAQGSNYAILDVVNHPETKAFAVALGDNNLATADPENFVVLGNGVTNIGRGSYQLNVQLRVETDRNVGCTVKTVYNNGGSTNFLAEVDRVETKAFSVRRFTNPTTSKEVFRVTGDGVVWSQEVRVRLAPFPDYVFDENYPLLPLDSLAQYIGDHHHLPGMPTAADVAANDANLGELVRLQQEKIEELTLYMIDMKKELEALKHADQ
jgi:hypothetical protein